ncbi:dephospho-CoA kinase [Luteipulveratus sp. YIM 133132]|uniref:dephospho-CoA kinase n=1 Tax=Luteipulveratus flavus TaxID=3031728 RepID=UPI0023B00407|nr:dephospho-CoA kinase [Luteipulveratus sp. YIM 133132]MDE9364533.1 dephospho-CoA kinase [Luteipulveratus sp. YIM 133132]
MLRVGLSGGIGSGKSTAARRLVERGAVLIDSDVIAREVVALGTPGLAQVVDRFGQDVLTASGELDRPALGRLVFGDTGAREALNAIVHPLVLAETQRQMGQAPTGSVVLHDIPLLVELGRAVDYHLVVIVDAPEDVRLQRLVTDRGMSQEDARARIAAQSSDEQRRAAADVLLPNVESVEALQERVDALWRNRIRPYADNLAAERRVRRPDQVSLTGPDPSWAVTGARLVGRIETQLARAGLGDRVVAVDHIGSTSVPGLAAKDVIDLQVRVRALDDALAEDFAAGLLAAGFTGRRGPETDTVHAFAPDPEQWRKVFFGSADPGRVVNVHVRAAASEGARTALLLRDWWRANPGERDAYAAMKAEMARQHPGADGATRKDYTDAKQPWIAAALLRARAWAAETGWTVAVPPEDR